MNMQRLVTAAELAEYLRVSTKTLERWRSDGSGPDYLLVGNQVRYSPETVSDWLRSRNGRGEPGTDASGVGKGNP